MGSSLDTTKPFESCTQTNESCHTFKHVRMAMELGQKKACGRRDTCKSLKSNTCDMTHSCVWHDSFICATLLIHMRDRTPASLCVAKPYRHRCRLPPHSIRPRDAAGRPCTDTCSPAKSYRLSAALHGCVDNAIQQLFCYPPLVSLSVWSVGVFALSYSSCVRSLSLATSLSVHSLYSQPGYSERYFTRQESHQMIGGCFGPIQI